MLKNCRKKRIFDENVHFVDFLTWHFSKRNSGCTTIQIWTIQILMKKLKDHNLKKSIYLKKNKNMYVGLINIYKQFFFSFCKILNIF